MNLVSKWFRKLFKKKIEINKEAYLFKGTTENFKPSDENVVLADVTDVVISYEDKVVGVGTGTLSGIQMDEDGNIFSDIPDLEMKQGFTIEASMVFSVCYSTIGYNFNTRAVTHDVYTTFKEAQLIKDNRIMCLKDNVETISIKRTVSA